MIWIYIISQKIKQINYSLIIFFLFSFHFAFAQQQRIDSLLVELKHHSKNDTIKVQLLSNLAYHYTNIFPDSTILLSKQAYSLASKLHYEFGMARSLIYWGIGSFLTSKSELAITQNKEALAICEKINDRKGIGSVYNNLAIIYVDQGNYKLSLQYYLKSLSIRKEIKDYRGVAANYNNIGNTYLEMGHYSESLSYLFKGLLLREEIGNDDDVSNSLSNIAGVYFHLGKYKEALDYNLRALAIDERSGNKQGIMSSLIIIGGVYLNQKEHEKALDSYTKALKLSEEMENPQSIALCLMNIGEEYISQERYIDAEKYFIRALTTWNEASDETSIAMSHTNLGIIYLHTGRVQKSIEYLTKGFNIASEIGNKFSALKASKNLAAAYKKINDFKNANLFLEKYIAYKDSLFNEESTKKAQQIEFDFILGKKQNEIALLQKDKSIQNAKSEKQNILSLTLTSVLCLITIIALVFYRSRQKEKASKEKIVKQKQEIEKQAQTLEELNLFKDKTFSVLSHDLRSPVASLSNVMMLMDQQIISPAEFDSLKDTLNGQLKSVSLLLDNLLHWSKSHMQGDHILPKATCSVRDLVNQSVSLFADMITQKNIELLVNIPDQITVYANCDQIDIVIRNLLSNAIKFTKSEGKIIIAAIEKNNQVQITIEDTGVGISDEYLIHLFSNTPNNSSYGTSGEKGTGIGLLLCKEFVEKNGGIITVKSELEKGSTFVITLPNRLI